MAILEILHADDRSSFRRVAKSGPLQTFMREVPLFAGLLPSELDRIALVMNPQDISAGDVLCTEGEPGHEFYVIASGEAGDRARRAHRRQVEHR